MMKNKHKNYHIALSCAILMTVIGLFGIQLSHNVTEPMPAKTNIAPPPIDEQGAYTTKDEVALYLSTYKHLPHNFKTKAEARTAGWKGGGLDPFFPDQNCCLGGDPFNNSEELLPDVSGEQYYECDIDTMHKDSRGAKRLVYAVSPNTADIRIYYTDDHYRSFTQIYGNEIEAGNFVLMADDTMSSNIAALHRCFSEPLNFPAYYGTNLDALYDMLSTYPEPVRIPPLNKGNLSYYGEVLLKVLTDAAAENSNIIIE